MRKLLLFAIVCMLGLFNTLSAQNEENVEILLNEDFESYEVGAKIAKDGADHWTTWSKQEGGAEDGSVAELNGENALTSHTVTTKFFVLAVIKQASSN